MTLKTSLTIGLTVAALVVGVQAASAQSLSDASERAKLATPSQLDIWMAEDGFDRAVATQEAIWMAEDGFDRAVDPAGQSSVLRDAHQRSVVPSRAESQSFVSPDSLGGSRAASVPGDHNERINPGTAPVSGTTAGSGREVEWPQVGIAFGLGIALALGLLLVIRGTRIRPLAH